MRISGTSNQSSPVSKTLAGHAGRLICLPMAFLCIGMTGCGLVPRSQLHASLAHSQQLYGEWAQAQSMASNLSAENQNLNSVVGQMHMELAAAQQQVGQLMAERDDANLKYNNLLASNGPGGNPLPGSANRRFEELARKYPQFEFDPETGVSKFNEELLFASGSDEIRSEGLEVLKEFSDIMNEGEARLLKIQVVGHTDDRPIGKPGTRSKHPSNWDLSVHRASQVVKSLENLNVAGHRMEATGCSKYQPVAANSDDANRQQNRRVEIYVLAPETNLADGSGRF